MRASVFGLQFVSLLLTGLCNVRFVAGAVANMQNVHSARLLGDVVEGAKILDRLVGPDYLVVHAVAQECIASRASC